MKLIFGIYIVIYFNYTLVSCNNFLAYNSIKIVFMIIMEFTFTDHLLEFIYYIVCFFNIFSCKCIPTTWLKQINIQQLAVTIHGQRDSHRQVGLTCMFTAMLCPLCSSDLRYSLGKDNFLNYRFPSDKVERKEWIINIRRDIGKDF